MPTKTRKSTTAGVDAEEKPTPVMEDASNYEEIEETEQKMDVVDATKDDKGGEKKEVDENKTDRDSKDEKKDDLPKPKGPIRKKHRRKRGGRARKNNLMTLQVRNLDYSVTENGLYDLFEVVAPVKRIRLDKDEDGRACGSAIVTATAKSAMAILKAFQGASLHFRFLKLSIVVGDTGPPRRRSQGPHRSRKSGSYPPQDYNHYGMGRNQRDYRDDYRDDQRDYRDDYRNDQRDYEYMDNGHYDDKHGALNYRDEPRHDRPMDVIHDNKTSAPAPYNQGMDF